MAMSPTVQVLSDHMIGSEVKGSRWRPSAADIWTYAFTFGPGLLLLAVIGLQSRVPIPVLMKDPLAVVPLTQSCCHFYYGFISNLGVMLWTAAAAVCLFASLLLVGRTRRSVDATFLCVAGVFTGWLALDDLFMIHEDVLPSFGVPQLVTYTAYAAIAASYFLYAWRQILAFRPVLMALALALLGTSVLIDIFWHSDRAVRVFVEDGAKFLGILAWASFHFTIALETITTSLATSRVVASQPS
jgi:hypothetical protein